MATITKITQHGGKLFGCDATLVYEQRGASWQGVPIWAVLPALPAGTPVDLTGTADALVCVASNGNLYRWSGAAWGLLTASP
jgi:hypothetical protein